MNISLSNFFVLFFGLFVIGTDGHALQSNKQPCEFAGDIFQIILPVSAFSTTLGLRDYEGTLQFVKTFTSTQATVEILKRIVHERRPRHGWHSFPSGHTAAAFSGAAFIHMRYGLRYGAPAYVLASFVGFSRVESKAHWVHDVLAGAAIGMFWNCIFTRAYTDKIRIYPVCSSKCAAIQCEHQF